MPINEILAVKSKQDIVNNTKLKLAINCAPILKGSKAAHIITVSLQEFNINKGALKGYRDILLSAERKVRLLQSLFI